MKVLVTDLHSRKSVAAIRELAAHGWQTVGIGRGLAPMGRFSKHLQAFRRLPPDPGALAPAILGFAREQGVDAIFPLEESTVSALASARAGGEAFPCLLPTEAGFQTSRDKWLSWQAAHRAGLHTPRTWLPMEREDAARIADEAAGRLVVKPRTGSGSRGLSWIESPSELPAVLEREYWSKGVRPIVQEALPSAGAGIGIFFVLGPDGAVLGSYGHRRLREYPLTGGPSTCCISERNEDAEAGALQLCRELGLVGPVMVEFKEDLDTGRLAFLEVNPRPWGSMALGAQCGVPVAHLCALAATGAPSVPLTVFEEGHEFRWMWPGELLHFASSPSSLSDKVRGLRPRRGRTCFAVASASDPLPMAGMALEMARRVLGKGGPG